MNRISAEQRQQLIDAAVRAQEHAYAPYSNFPVGAAVLTEGGQIFVGCNVENASYGLTICAERTAIFSAVAAGHQRFAMLSVASVGGYPPCGACRQVIAEFCDDVLVLIVDARTAGKVDEVSLVELLPHRFDRG